MPDLTTITAALSSIKTATDIARLIKDSGTSLEQAEIKLQIAELISSLADAKIEIASIQNDVVFKEQEILELKNKLNVKQNVTWEKPYYWIAEGESKDGPFCQQCYDTGQKLIRLQGGGKNAWHCQACKSRVTDKNYVKPSVNRRRIVGGF